MSRGRSSCVIVGRDIPIDCLAINIGEDCRRVAADVVDRMVCFFFREAAIHVVIASSDVCPFIEHIVVRCQGSRDVPAVRLPARGQAEPFTCVKTFVRRLLVHRAHNVGDGERYIEANTPIHHILSSLFITDWTLFRRWFGVTAGT